MANKKLKNFEYANHTSRGKSTGENSDDLAFFECINGFVYIICDGKATGSSEVKPSALTIERLKYYLENEFVENPSDAVYNALVYANGFIYEYARKNPEFNHPRVSCSILLIRNNEMYYCVAGNSTINFFNGRKLFVLAKGDESISPGEKTDDLLSDGYFLGEKQNIVPDVNREPLIALNDDMIMLSSDGFTDFVSEKQVLKILADPMPVQTKVYRLADMAVHAGSEDNISIQLVAFYNLDHTERKFVPLRLKGKKMIKDANVGRKEKSDDSSYNDKTSQSELNPILEKLENPAVKYTLLALGILLVIYMFYDLFLYNPVRPVKYEPTINREQIVEESREEVTAISETKVPEDRIYTIQPGDNWSRIYTQFGVCSWFIRNHPPNRGKFDSADNPVAGSRINIPVVYSSRRDLNPDFYQQFSTEKTGSRCENADQEFLDNFKESHL